MNKIIINDKKMREFLYEVIKKFRCDINKSYGFENSYKIGLLKKESKYIVIQNEGIKEFVNYRHLSNKPIYFTYDLLSEISFLTETFKEKNRNGEADYIKENKLMFDKLESTLDYLADVKKTKKELCNA